MRQSSVSRLLSRSMAQQRAAGEASPQGPTSKFFDFQQPFHPVATLNTPTCTDLDLCLMPTECH
jgi:hypothetical protein